MMEQFSEDGGSSKKEHPQNYHPKPEIDPYQQPMQTNPGMSQGSGFNGYPASASNTNYTKFGDQVLFKSNGFDNPNPSSVSRANESQLPHSPPQIRQ